MNQKRPRVLVFCDYYLPGYKGGGGPRTIVNMVERLGHGYDFRIVTGDHDAFEEGNRYEGVRVGEWNRVGNGQVLYLKPKDISPSGINEVILSAAPDAIYTNSFFSRFTRHLMKLRRRRRIPDIPTILAPCGELAEGALAQKSVKKWAFVRFARAAALYNGVIWKASTELEAEEISRIMLAEPETLIAPDLPPESIFPEYREMAKPDKYPGGARMVFLSRLSRKKNIKWLLELLREVKGELSLDIYGPAEDDKYRAECEAAIESLPGNIRAALKGPVRFEDVGRTLFDHQFFVMPTLGENFGHVLLEAMAAGCPLLISDKTPWLSLFEKGVGWDIPPEDPAAWLRAIGKCIAMDSGEYRRMSRAARDHAGRWLADEDLVGKTERVLERALGRSDP